MRTINLFVIHCADTYATMDIGVKEIDGWHRKRGWSGIGYHFVIRRNGIVETGRQINLMGAHAEGFNANSIGICYAGGKGTNGKPEDNRTPEQKESLRKLIAELHAKYPGAKVVGHHDLNPGKPCPCFNVKNEYQ